MVEMKLKGAGSQKVGVIASEVGVVEDLQSDVAKALGDIASLGEDIGEVSASVSEIQTLLGEIELGEHEDLAALIASVLATLADHETRITALEGAG